MAFDLFVMVTNFDDDHVPNDPKILKMPETCNSPYIFCGLPRRLYPDAKPLGYPFDRPLFKSLDCPPGYSFAAILCKSVNLLINRPMDTLEEYVSRAPNMASLKFIIRHIDAFFPEPSRH
ncbi:Phenoloxidase 3 [Orchesella cincta]|uniref:Phenoloxidase 3 n=1 Tax=Orchesella cincta TaxID=48709 RepID=A0A1D2MZ93_ORCCI|nr:Phenoloxidase 3 [Orchesella cincta]